LLHVRSFENVAQDTVTSKTTSTVQSELLFSCNIRSASTNCVHG